MCQVSEIVAVGSGEEALAAVEGATALVGVGSGDDADPDHRQRMNVPMNGPL